MDILIRIPDDKAAEFKAILDNRCAYATIVEEKAGNNEPKEKAKGELNDEQKAYAEERLRMMREGAYPDSNKPKPKPQDNPPPAPFDNSKVEEQIRNML